MAINFERIAARTASPLSWRVSTRRIFMVALPLSLPLWLASLVLISLIYMARSVLRPLRVFWNAPPKRQSTSYYGYGSYRRALAENAQRKLAEADPSVRPHPVEFPRKKHIERPQTEAAGWR